MAKKRCAGKNESAESELESRMQVTPNLGFFEQLSIWEKDTAGYRSIASSSES